MSNEQPAFKTILKQGANTIGNLLSVSFDGYELEFKDTTHHGLTDGFRTQRAVLAKVKNVKAKVQMTSANIAALYALVDPLASFGAWTITYPFSTPIVVTLNAQLASLGIGGDEVDGILEVDIELAISGKPTIA